MKRRDLVIGAGAAVLAAWVPSAARAATTVLGGLAFGSTWRAVLPAQIDEIDARGVIEAIIADVDATMSPYKADSALSRFNRSRERDWLPMPAGVCAVAREALSVARLTEGAFDPTVGPLVHRFGFGPIRGEAGGWRTFNVGQDALLKGEAGATLDLCGVAKGHALDRIISALRGLGAADALVELGGEVAALGRHPEGRDWTVVIENPNADGWAVQRIVAPRDLALATSGHRVNGLRGPVSVSHIIDPTLSRPVDNGIASVSVLASTAMRADALATALSAMDGAKAVAFADKHGIAALFVRDDGRDVMTGAFGAHVVV